MYAIYFSIEKKDFVISTKYDIIGVIYSPRRQAPLGMPSMSSQSTPCHRAKYNQDVNSDWRIKMAHSTSNSNFKRSATMTGIAKGQRRDVQKTKTHVSCAQLGCPTFFVPFLIWCKFLLKFNPFLLTAGFIKMDALIS